AVSRLGTANWTQLSGPVIIDPPPPPAYPWPVTITTGNSVTFEWLFVATGVGTTNFSVLAYGRDEGIGDILTTPMLSTTVSVEAPASLSSSLWSKPSVVNAGNNITVTLSLTNGAGAVADCINNYLTWGYTVTGTGSVTQISGPTTHPEGPFTISGAANAVYEWVFNATDSGTFSFTASVSGADEHSGQPVTTGLLTSNTVRIQRPATLTSYLTTIPPVRMSRTQVVTVILTVSNTGDSTADSVYASPYLVYSNNGTGATLLGIDAFVPGGITTIEPITIAGNSVGSFTWTYSATQTGEITFTGRAAGIDAISGNPVTSAEDSINITITPPSANLSCQLSYLAIDDPVPLNSTVYLILNVTNYGIADARAVTPVAVPYLTENPVSGLVTLTSGPSPSYQDRITAYGGSAAFTWVYNVGNGAGTINFSAYANAMTEGTSMSLSASDDVDMVIRPSGANFAVSISALPDIVSLGQEITVIMTATNRGQTTALNFMPGIKIAGQPYSQPGSVTPVASGSGNVIAITGPQPVSAMNVAPDGIVTFTWTFSATTSGNVAFNVSTWWDYFDVYSGVTPAANTSVTSNVVSIQPGLATPGAGNVFALDRNKFNPLAGESVKIIFSVTDYCPDGATVMIFNVAGQRVRTMKSTQPISNNITYTQMFSWDGRADDGKLVTTGIYYIKLVAGNYSQTLLVAVVKQ
ncbi:MAG TPA: hypothetical protein PLF61_02915, partial [Candidatus Goldiibacteriota bacterium]|nr:hypothetical protein [Candidatus Goldiibacteriota bacterium]